MFKKLCLAVEAPLAPGNWTDKLSIIKMSFLMILQILFGYKTLWANGALVKSTLKVLHNMDLHVRFSLCLVIADCLAVAFLKLAVIHAFMVVNNDILELFKLN
jgi:hypothetical protein